MTTVYGLKSQAKACAPVCSLMAPTLVKIGKEQRRSSLIDRLLAAPLVHKFFLLGLIFGIIGTIGLGAYLWLVLNGQLSATAINYQRLKGLHALIQIHLFLGAFIVGFCLQTAPKLLEVSRPVPREVLCLMIPFILAIVAFLLFPFSDLYRYLVALPFISTAALMFHYCRYASWRNRLRMGVPVVFGLCALGVGATTDTSNPAVGLVIFWCGVMAIILGVAQQFIIWILEGHKLLERESSILFVIFFAAAAAGIIACNFPGWYERGFVVMGLASTAALLYFFIVTQGITRAFERIGDPMGLALVIAFINALLGSILLSFGGQYADATLHIWATGVATTLIIVVSCRVLGVLSGRDLFGPRTMIGLLLLWQVVPFGRGLARIIDLPPGFSWGTGAAATVVFLIWGMLVIQRVAQLLLRQLRLSAQQILPEC